MERNPVLVSRNEVWFAWASQINHFRLQKGEMGALDAGAHPLLPPTCHLQHHRIHLWLGRGPWSVGEGILGLWVILDDTGISAVFWLCWKSWPTARCPFCRCFLVLLLPGGDMPSGTRFESLTCRSSDGNSVLFCSSEHAEQEHGRASSSVMNLWVTVQQNWPVLLIKIQLQL